MSETKLVCRGCGGVCGQQTEHGRIVDRVLRRIRRAQRAALLDLFAEACRLAVEDNAVGRALPLTAIHDIIDAATRAKKGRRK